MAGPKQQAHALRIGRARVAAEVDVRERAVVGLRQLLDADRDAASDGGKNRNSKTKNQNCDTKHNTTSTRLFEMRRPDAPDFIHQRHTLNLIGLVVDGLNLEPHKVGDRFAVGKKGRERVLVRLQVKRGDEAQIANQVLRKCEVVAQFGANVFSRRASRLDPLHTRREISCRQHKY